MKRFLLAAISLLAGISSVRADATLVFNEIMYHPATNEPAMEWVELYNQMAVDLDVSGWRLIGDIGYTFPAGSRVRGRGFIVVAINPAALAAATGLTNVVGPFTNRLSNSGGTLRLRNNNDRVLNEVVYGTEGEWPVAPDGAGPSLAKVDEDLGSADPANWRASLQMGGSPGTKNIPRATTTILARPLVPISQTWKYDQSGADLGTAWRGTSYNDSAWPAGPALLADETCNCLPEPIRTPLTVAGNKTTFYFRTTFNYTGNVASASLSLRPVVDDGLIAYLNGTEVWRIGVNDPVTSATLASRSVTDASYEGPFSIPSTGLVSGTNVLAVEVHQVTANSSDIVFGLQLDDVSTVTNAPGGSSATNLPVAFNEISSVTNAQFWIELVNLGTQSVALDNLVLSRFSGTTNREYVIPAQTLPPGGYFVLDRATIGFGADPGDRVVLYGPGKTTVLDALVAKSYPRARLPRGTGEWLRPSAPTPGASNSFALRTEIVINEIMYQHKPFPSVNGLPAQGNPEEWIELFNRSASPVDLTGWELDDGIRYKFAPGKTLAPGAYLVVAKNAVALRTTYPAIDIVGDFSGSLSSKGERLVLMEPTGNPADVVQYFSSGRWSRFAGGGGSSLELRDPNADNSKAEAWAPSDESGKSSWQNYSYRMVAQASVTANPDGQWREFLMGLLGAGECLIDDIRVVVSPTNNPVSLVSNGDFESGQTGWRVLGTHGASQVIPEPGKPGNRVLRVVATGTQEHMHNHIVTTLSGGQSVVNGQLYEISYRAKWVTGNSLLNTRFWFNRVARTMELAAPQNNGTPGVLNSRYEPNVGPTFAQLQHEPVVPAANAPVTVTVEAQDPQGVTNCQVFWSAAGAAFSSAPMTLQPDGLFSATIPGYAAGTVVQFYVRGVDGQGAVATFPARAGNGGALYKVNDGQANLSLQHTFRIITTPANAALLHADTNLMSNDNLPCTVVYDERIAYYEVGLRLKGSFYGRPNSSRVGFHLAFQPDQLFRGVHPVMGMDRRPGDNSPRNEEIVVRHIAQVAGGVPVMYLDIVGVLSPRGTENGAALITPSYEDEFIDSAFENGGDGNLFEMDGIYYSSSANAAGYKLPSGPTQFVEMTDRGNDKEPYRYNYIRKNNSAQDDYSSFIVLAKAFALSGTALETQTKQLMDLDEWLRAYAVLTLCGVDDTYSFWLEHNMMMYFRPSDHKAVYLMWDSDFSFARSATSTIVGDKNLGKIVNLPSNLRVLYAHMLDIMSTTYNTTYMASWLTHYGLVAGATYARLPYIQQRSDYVNSVIAGAGGNTPFSVSSTNITITGSNLVTLSGNAPVVVKTITVNGVAWPVTWTSLTAWTLRLPASMATNTLQIAGLDLRGNLVPNTSFNATAVVNAPLDSPAGQVVINEIMYEAAAPGAEYIELYNRSTTTTFDLSGWRLNGLDYTFPPGSYFAPRTYLVLAKNRSLYASIYGGSTPLFDEFDGEFQLDGETITLIQPGTTPAQDLIIDRVRYEGDLPWAASATAGTGSSYQLIDLGQDNSRAGNWTARYVPAVYEGEVIIPARTNTGWRFVSFTGSIGNGIGSGQQRLLIYLAETNGASAIIDDVSLVDGTNAAVGFNYIRNGDFEAPPLLETPALTNSWVVNVNYTNSAIISGLTHSGAGALRIEATTFGNAFGKVISQNLSPAPVANSTNTLSFWFWSTNSATNLVVRIQNSAALTTGTAGTNINSSITLSNYIPPTILSPATNYLTPGAANQFTASLPAFPTLWINEVQSDHFTGLLDNQGQPDPWIEIYNSGTNTVSLTGLYLSGNYTNLTNWAFPSGTSLAPKQFLVIFCDGQPLQTASNQLHTHFRLPPVSGSVALSRLHNNQPQVIDYVNYAGLHGDRSYGSFPDGQSFDRQQFFYVTPGGTNDGRSAPLTVFINEWMAANSTALADPADGAFNDWFELYNPGTNAVNIADYYLTDTLTNRFKYRITTNGAHVIPPQGYLLVWADNETGQNMIGGVPRADLHVNFQLAAAGEAIGLFAADGTQIDAITFGLQPTDVSMGRYPDGSANLAFMPGAASPRAANYLAGTNSAPELASIGGRTLFLGQTLAFTASATDAEAPPQVLTFTLDPVPPAGTSITSAGAFIWSPASIGTFPITIRVTDNGVPQRSAAETFSVEVLAAPAIERSVRNGSTLELTWNTRAGQSYAVDYKTNLNAVVWTPLWTTLASGSSLSFTNSTTNAPQGFFRIRAGGTPP